MGTVVPATAGPLGERPPALAGHFCNVPTTVFAVLMSLYPAATCHEGPLSLRTGGGRSWQVLLYPGKTVQAICTSVRKVSVTLGVFYYGVRKLLRHDLHSSQDRIRVVTRCCQTVVKNVKFPTRFNANVRPK